MIDLLSHIRAIVAHDKYQVTAHAFVELNKDNLLAGEIVSGLAAAVVVEAYPDYHKGPSILVLQHDAEGNPVHALWGIPKDKTEPAFLVTAYRPDAQRWTSDFLTRRLK